MFHFRSENRFPTSRLCLAALVAASGAFARSQVASAQSVNVNQLLAKAPPDECFFGKGSGQNVFPATPPCQAGFAPKVNQAYVWGLARAGSRLFFGTAANVQCLVFRGYLNISTPFQTPSYVCEFGSSTFNGVDWRPPKLYAYDLAQKKTADLSAAAQAGLNQTLGVRSAGSIGDIVFLAGPTLDNKGIYVFAFRSDGVFLGSRKLTAYNDIRQWVVMNGSLYTGVRKTSDKTGRVLRWTGSVASPFEFEEVGRTDAEVAYLAVLNDKLYGTTWGGGNTGMQNPPPSGLWVSPPAIGGPLSSANLLQWKKVWDVNQYETDPVTAASLVGGAVVAYGGSVYWGLMQVPLTGVLAHYIACPSAPRTAVEVVKSIVNTTRPIPIFRIADGGVPGAPSNPRATLLYGAKTLAKYDCANSVWTYPPNKAANSTPLYGPAGFGNPFNTYAWAGSVFQNRLYFGTFDWSYLLADGVAAIIKAARLPAPSGFDYNQLLSAFSASPAYSGNLRLPIQFGADLWRFDSAAAPAKPESLNGLGNYLNYGVRTMVADSAHLYLGMANPMNLKTTPGRANGGWELRALTPGALPGGR